MKNLIKKIAKKIISSVSNLFKIPVYFEKTDTPAYLDIIENKYGHKQTRQLGIPCNSESEPIPWYTYPAIEYIQQLDLTNLKVFEWGAGNSSLFFANRTKEVYSVESDKDWFNDISKRKLINNTIFLETEKDSYVAKISTLNKIFDIIIIDGKYRKECSEICLNYLSENSMIILDNSDRHPDIAKTFREQNLLEIDMHGLGPINNYTWTTSLFFKRNIKLNPVGNQPIIPIGGGY